MFKLTSKFNARDIYGKNDELRRRQMLKRVSLSHIVSMLFVPRAKGFILIHQLKLVA